MVIVNIASILGAFSNRNFAIYVSGNSISLVGNWVQRVAVGWLTWELTGSNTWIGVIVHAALNGPGFVAVAFGLA